MSSTDETTASAQADAPAQPTDEPREVPMKLFAFVKRREDLDHEQFLRHWREVHGPLIRDTPGLGDRILSYVQHEVHPNDRSGFDGVAVQEFASWEDFLAMLADPAGEAMRADETNFLDPSSFEVAFTGDEVVMIDRRPG